jgi:antitoxin component HigA of HigAB toxin-antitoxin module
MPTSLKKPVADSYLDHVREFPLRRIKSAAEHSKAIAAYLRVSKGKRDRGTSDYIEVLLDLISDFEKRSGYTIDTSEVTAADLIRHKLEERGMSVSALAREVGVAQSNLSEMLNGTRDWSKAAIRGLSRYLNIRAERFLA